MVRRDFRAEIKQRLDRLGKSKLWLAEKLEGRIGQNTLYTYLRGETDMGSEKVSVVLDILDEAERKTK